MGFHMIWLLVVSSIFAICVLAGRAHSRYLDRVEAKSSLKIRLLNVASGSVEQIESANHLAAEPDRQTAVAISVGNQMWICPGAYEARLISTEGELLETYDLRNVAAGDVADPTRSGRAAPPRKKSKAA
jgi:hypothetical protein